MIILGIDPGTAMTGYGLIRKTGSSDFKCLAYGIISTSSLLPAPERLKILHKELLKLIRTYKPDILAVENLYFFKNLKTAMPVSQAKGVILLAAAQKNLRVKEFTPPQVKMGIAGYGKAEKKQIQKVIRYLLKLKEIPRPDDAADALAIAVCCAKSLKPLTNISKTL